MLIRGGKLSDFKAITKLDVKQDYYDYINTAYLGKTVKVHTSGTTGSGLVFPISVDAEQRQWAVWWRFRESIGIKFGTWCGWFGGRQMILLSVKRPPYWRINRPGKQVMFSTYHLNAETVHYFIDEIKRRKLTWLHGYPSILSYLAKLAQQTNLTQVECVKFITTGGENLLPSQIEMLQRAFPNAIVRTHFGLTEGVSNISQTADGDWKIDSDYAYTELIPVDEEVSSDIVRCRIVGTGFTNLAFPLIRYDTGDIALVKEVEGKKKIVGIEGRSGDYFILKNGTKLTGILATFIFNEMLNVVEAQVRLKKEGSIELLVVKGPAYSTDDEEKLMRLAKKHIASDIDIYIAYTNSIQRTKAGKFRAIVAE